MEDQPRILVVEDDRRLAGMLAEILEDEGYAVTLAHDGQRALHEGLTGNFDVLLLDRGLPAIEGLDVMARLRSRGVLTPVLVLSALGNPSDRVEGLDRGAEDYLAKPFDMDELLARLRALRRRTLERIPVLPVPGGTFDPEARTVSADTGKAVQLSEREAELLEVLARHPGRIYPRVELQDLVFPDADDDGVVDTYVHYLRRKLGRPVVMTVRGVGYRLGRSP
ncbi:response regulator transcription factor [Arthrobacter zhangbolii]|uniref:Response regulator transcription factor n=1 Tax=Arthrobacter zhangbolii TaxID=2886936 RepID=A0A9X1M611_9MICC|nr:response regulator transcription factor [Arthrobacter zhangbolii]MCC3272108.1 response regulator transcription factor [Arthrobacter zhangbolii]UON92018.1 response regulator transcription factor [Arthrobacter zhangbolii]